MKIRVYCAACGEQLIYMEELKTYESAESELEINVEPCSRCIKLKEV